jgi:thaumarchaeosortase
MATTPPPPNSNSMNTITKLLPLLALAIPFLILYYLYPDSFELTWKGRTFYIFFLWLIFMELIINWDKLPTTKIKQLKSARTWAVIAAIILPILYVIATNYWGLNTAILNFGVNDVSKYINIAPDQYNNIITYLPLSTEYLVFTVLFVVIISVYYGRDQLINFSLSTFFLGIIGIVYTIDNLYPFGRFTPFQIVVPTTTMLAASVLNMMGFATTISYIQNNPQMGSLTTLKVQALHGGSATYNIAWPCSGVESLLLYSVVILLFLKDTAIPLKQRIAYFAVGAGVTYFINALRIATIFIIAINGGDVETFHNFTGQFYSISWIMAYPLIIMASRALWGRIARTNSTVQNRSEANRGLTSSAGNFKEANTSS